MKAKMNTKNKKKKRGNMMMMGQMMIIMSRVKMLTMQKQS